MISVCVLSFNRLASMTACLNTLLDQRGVEMEIIVGDDGSEDDAIREELCKRVQDGHVSSVLLNPPGHNEGVGAMVNRLFGLARGDHLVKCDQDLMFVPFALARMVTTLESNERIATVGGFRYWHDPVDHRVMTVRETDDATIVADYVSSAMMMRRETWEKYGPWEWHSEAFAEDIGFKRDLTEEGFLHALTKEDVISNQGFGVGPSTVVVGEGQVQPIRRGPWVLDNRWARA